MTPTNTKSSKPVNVLLVAIGGYGRLYVQALKNSLQTGQVSIRAVVDPLAEKSPDWPSLEAAGVPRFDTINEFLASGGRADLAVISSPIALHADHTCAALEAGMNVLCEKPLTAHIDDAYRMTEARDRSGKFLEIGYQWSFSHPIQRLKADIQAGRFGAPRRFRTWVAWPRSSDYYDRNNWAGRIRDDAGRWVYDSPVNNATAHYLHNMLYLLGPNIDRAATPTAITGECYRANPIENFDMVCCRIETKENVDVLFYSAHCVQENRGPISRFEFDNGTVETQANGEVTAHSGDGRIQRYGNPEQQYMRKLEHCIERCRADNGGHTICGPEAAMAQALCINGLQQMPIHDLGTTHTKEEKIADRGVLTYIPGLQDTMRQACESRRLFSEMNLSWACPAQRIEIYQEPTPWTSSKRSPAPPD